MRLGGPGRSAWPAPAAAGGGRAAAPIGRRRPLSSGAPIGHPGGRLDEQEVPVADPEEQTAAAAPRAGPRRPRTVVLVVHGRVTPDTIAVLCARVRVLLGDPTVGTVTCDLSGVVEPDAVALDALARMQLTARRMGRTIRLRHVQPEMRALLALVGLTDVVPAWPDRPRTELPDDTAT
jgi:ABC-type transporter Mla MlaB component